MRTPVRTTNHRRVLCIFPAYAPAFGTFSHAFRLVGAKAFMPPQGLLLIANYLPWTWAVRFIDENMQCAQRADKATREMLPHLVAWQKKHGYPVSFACEATLNIAKQPEILAMMQEARFDAVFIGIETPELDALKAIRKEHNAALPMLEAIQTLNSYGLEVASGIILGLDSDTPETETHLTDFVNRSQIPMLTMNLLQALPKTALWDRLARDGRLVENGARESNVRFVRPYEEVVAAWRR